MLLSLSDPLAAYQFDAAVVLFGAIIDNALSERVNHGSKEHPDWRPKYTLGELLDASFRLPAISPVAKPTPTNGIAALMAMAGRSGGGVKLWKTIPPV